MYNVFQALQQRQEEASKVVTTATEATTNNNISHKGMVSMVRGVMGKVAITGLSVKIVTPIILLANSTRLKQHKSLIQCLTQPLN